MMVKSRVKYALVFSVLIGIGLIVRLAFALNMGSVDGDVAVFGLMAKHILEMKEFPAYLVLMHYAGSMVSYVGAVFFKFFGVSPTVFNLVGALFSFSWVILILFMAKELLGRFGVVVALLSAALPFYGFLRYSLLTGQYGDSVFFMLLALFVLIKWAKSGYKNATAAPMLLGFCCGVVFWITPAAAPVLLTTAVVMLSHYRKRPFFKVALFFLAGFLIGYVPAIAHNLQYPSATLFRMAGKALDLDRSVLSAPNPADIVFQRILLKISIIPGSFFKMPNLIATLIGVPAAALFIISMVFVIKDHGFRRDAGRDMWYVMCIYVYWCVIFHIILVQIPKDRYMAPLCTVFPLFIGYLVSRFRPRFRSLGIALLSAVILYNCCTIARSFPDRNANRYTALAGRLVAKGLHYGFSDYYTGYITQFETKEKIAISPTLFHPTFCDRWPAETKRIRSAREVFYVIDKHRYPEAALALEEKCEERGISYKKEDIEGFGLYYDFSSKIYPEDLPIKKAMEKSVYE
ncbi:MAG: glycosyltransferase family 39 protein [Candidatus Omnitrophica bacterium]|nr:glycosyltransferase family 39 protein [Candidatus Omnitrophota bacterium]